MGTIDDILNEEPSAEPEIQTEAPEVTGRPRDEHGRFAPKEEGEPETQPQVAAEPESAPPAQDQEAGHIPIAALKDERTKRQQAEEQLRKYEEHFQALQQQMSNPAPLQYQQPVDSGLDPETQAFIDLIREQVSTEVLQNVQSYTQNQFLMERGRIAEWRARDRYQDYDDTVEHFKMAAGENEFLMQELLKADDPAEYAYRVGKKVQEAHSIGQAPSREQIEAEIEAKLREKLKAELGLPATRQAPSTLAAERSVGTRSGPAWTGPTPLGDLLK